MPASNKIVPFMNGMHSRLVTVQDRVRLAYDWKTWSLKPNVTKHADGVNGEDADRLDVTLNYYEITAAMYVKSASMLRDWLAAQAMRDAKVAAIDQEGAMRFYPRNGTRESYVLGDLIFDDFDLNQGGRAERMMCTWNMRCTSLKEAKTP